MKLQNIFILGPCAGDESIEKRKQDTEKLYFQHILPYFKWNDLLRLRRVCKDAKHLADKFIRTEGEKLCPEITIYEPFINKDKCLTRFLQLGFPATSIYINNTSGAAMFIKDAKNFAKFAESSGPKIIHVGIQQLSNFPVGAEMAFFESLPNLKSLQVDMFGSLIYSYQEAKRRSRHFTGYWPHIFKQLKKVTIGNRPNEITVDAFCISRSLTEDCEELQFCADAFTSVNHQSTAAMHQVLGVAFNMIQTSIDERAENAPTTPNLKFYDFNNFHKCVIATLRHSKWLHSPSFIKLLISCVKHSVQLLNVNSAWLQHCVLPNYQQDACTLSSPVISMVNLHGRMIPLPMPNLEKLTISSTSESSLIPEVWKTVRKQWPALKIINVYVDSNMLDSTIVGLDETMKQFICTVPDSTTSLMKFLFVGIQRLAVTEVSLAFDQNVHVEDDTVKAATFLGVSCPNMKKLSLVNWTATNETVIRILSDVKSLEELCLDNCNKIGNQAFIKTDSTDGLLQKHPDLKKLFLKQLDNMPNITDILFQDVISRMKLSHLHLSSNKPLTNITPNGISALKNGEFATTIEYFPFTGWSLANVSKGAFKIMQQEFRAYNMI